MILRQPPEHMALLGEMRRRLRAAARERETRGLVPFEGRWLTREDLAALLRRRRRRLGLIGVEVIVVLAALASLSAALLGLTALMAY